MKWTAGETARLAIQANVEIQRIRRDVNSARRRLGITEREYPCTSVKMSS